MKKINIIIFLIFIISINVYTQINPPIPSSFPSSFPGARVKALAGAATALLGNEASVFYNPATAAFLDTAVLHISFAEENNATISKLTNTQSTIWGKHINLVSMMTFQGGLSYHPLYSITYSNMYDNIDNSFRDLDIFINEYILTLTTYTGANEKYAVPFILGINLKYLNGLFADARIFSQDSSLNNIDSVFTDISKGNGYGIDFGIVFEKESIVFGLSIRNLLTHIYWSGDIKNNKPLSYNKTIIPMQATAGFSYYPLNNLTMCLDIDRILEKDKPFIYRTGIEYILRREISKRTWYESLFSGSIAFRSGIVFKKLYGLEAITLALGIGYNVDNYRLDIAVEGDNDAYMQGGLTYQISMNFPIIF